ncbi:hypothetical protein Y032_0006g3040 [Ancylostoma ceylanicum]|uniref:Uncharacterized protein n=1 Tax=Ancylostoma ceylanicum TaxID=53326 RepID=A0A016VQA5_9BILA|nr:hypothetical protein Y032_0006g3040 [Ancylostoma ceylanicum]
MTSCLSYHTVNCRSLHYLSPLYHLGVTSDAHSSCDSHSSLRTTSAKSVDIVASEEDVTVETSGTFQ